MLEYKKYSTAMTSLSEILKQKGELFKTSVNEAISSTPQNHEKIENMVEKILSQIPYSKRLTEVAHLNCALELKKDALEQALGEVKPSLRSHHSNYQGKKGEILVPKQEVDDDTVCNLYMTTDGTEIEHHLSTPPPNITNAGGERFGNQQPDTSYEQELEDNSSLNNNGQFVPTHRREKSTGEKQWSTNDLIQVLTALTRNGQNNARNQIQFPEMKTPQFNGSQDSFDEFWAMFNQMVHLNQQFTSIEKFLNLTSHLTGRAANAIKGIKMIPQNYELALDIILQRFGNRDSNQTSIVQLIKSIEPANRSPESCRDLFQKIYSHLQHLKSIGCNIMRDCDPLWKETIFERFASIVKKMYS